MRKSERSHKSSYGTHNIHHELYGRYNNSHIPQIDNSLLHFHFANSRHINGVYGI